MTKSELENIREDLGLNVNKFELLTQTISYIFKQSLKVILKPTTLQKQLVEVLNFHSDKADLFVKAWMHKTKQDFENLGERFKLDKISWELNLQTSSTLESKEVSPNLRLKFGLSNPNNADLQNLVFQLEEKELLQMYNTIENIQNKIDFLQRIE